MSSSRATNTRVEWYPGMVLAMGGSSGSSSWRFRLLCKTSKGAWITIGNWQDEQGWRWTDLRYFHENTMQSLQEVNE